MAPIIKDSAKVDSASIISGLGYTPFNETGDTLTGTGGAGFYGAIPQSSSPSTPGSGFRLYANASHALSWVGQNGFTRTFDGTANTANRAYTLPNSSGTIALEGTLTSLANPIIQNGVYQFVQTTKPTERSSGVALVAGDRWYKTDDGTEWFWNGTYWLSPPYLKESGVIGNYSAISNLFVMSLSGQYNLFLNKFLFGWHRTSSAPSVNDFWTLTLTFHAIQSDNRSLVYSYALDETSLSAGTTRGCLNEFVFNSFVETKLPVTTTHKAKLLGAITPTGSPPTLRSPYISLLVHDIHP